MSDKNIKVYARLLIGLLLLIVILLCIETVRFLMLPLLFGAFIAMLLTPVNNVLLEKAFSKNLASFIPIFALFGTILVVLYFFTIPLLKSTQNFLVSFPSKLMFIQNRLGITKVFNMLGITEIISDSITDFIEQLLSVPKILSYLVGAVKWLYVILLTPVFAFYILRDRKNGLNGVNYLLPQDQKKSIYRLVGEIYNGITMYVYGYLFIGFLCMGVSLVCFGIIRLENFVFLAFFMGVCSFVPFVGPFVGGIPAIVVAFGNGWRLWYVVLVVLFVSQFAASILTPRTIGNSSNVHPIFGLIAMIIGFGLFGLWGIILAVPVFVIVRPVIKYIFSYFFTQRL